MSHLDEEKLALIALGEPVCSSSDDVHLDACPACRAELDSMRHAALVARTTVSEQELEAPPDHVWANIATELGLSDPLQAQQPTSVRRRPGRRWLFTLAASVALVSGIGIAWEGLSGVGVVRIADAALVALPAHPGATGTADVTETREGARYLEISIVGAGTTEGYREVWLLNSDATALVSLGVLEEDGGTFAIPEDVDLSEYDLVDVSDETVDGDPAHSGDSIVRGSLTVT